MYFFKYSLFNLINFTFFKAFFICRHKFVRADIFHFVFGSFLGLLFFNFIVLIIFLKLSENLIHFVKPLVQFGKLLINLVIVQFSKYFLHLVFDIFLVLHRIRFFLLLGASSYDPLSKIFYDSIALLKGEFLMDFYNVSSKFIFSEDFNLPTSIFSKTPIFDSSKNFFYVHLLYNLFGHVMNVQQNIRTIYFFQKKFDINSKSLVQNLNKPSNLMGHMLISNQNESNIRPSLPNHIYSFIANCGELFHFDFFLFLHNLNYFLLNPTVFSHLHILVLKYFRTIRASMLFILLNLENDSFLHFLNVILYKLALRNYYTRSDWENLVNTYELSMTNSFAFNGDSKSDLILIIKISFCYGFLLCNCFIFYILSVIFSLGKSIIYIRGYNEKIRSQSYFNFANLICFFAYLSYSHFEFHILKFSKICYRILMNLKPKSEKPQDLKIKHNTYNLIRSFSTFFTNFPNLFLLFILSGLYFLTKIKTIWSFFVLTYYQRWSVLYPLLIYHNDKHVSMKLFSLLFAITQRAFSSNYYTGIFKQITERLFTSGLGKISLDQAITNVQLLRSGLITGIEFTLTPVQTELLFNFFKLKFFVNYFSRFCFTHSMFFPTRISLVNIYVSHFLAFLLLFGSKVFYRWKGSFQKDSVDFNDFFQQLKINYGNLIVGQYYLGLLITYFRFYFGSFFIVFRQIYRHLPLVYGIKFLMFVIVEIGLFSRKLLFYVLINGYNVVFYCIMGLGLLLINFVFFGLWYFFVNFFYFISLVSIFVLCLVVIISCMVKIVSFLEYKIFMQPWIFFSYLVVHVWLRLYYFRYKSIRFLRGRNFGFLEILSIFFVIRNDLKKYEIIHTQMGFQLFNSVTTDMVINEFLHKHLSNYHISSDINQRTLLLQDQLPIFDFTALKLKFKLPLKNLIKFKQLSHKSEFSRIQLKKDIFPEFEYHKYLRSRDIRNLSLFRFRKSLEPMNFYFDPVLDELNSLRGDNSNFFSFDFLKVFYVDDILFGKLLNYFRYVFSRDNLSFFYDNLDRLSIFRVRYSKLSPLFRYFFLKREKIKYLLALYTVGNINPFTFSIVINWIRNYKILRAVLNLYKSFDSSLVNYLYRVNPTFQLIQLTTLISTIVVLLRLWGNFLFWLFCLGIFIYVTLNFELTAFGVVGIWLCLLRIYFIFPILTNLFVFVKYAARHHYFFTPGLKLYSVFNRFIWILFVQLSVAKTGLIHWFQSAMVFGGMVLIIILLCLCFQLDLQFELGVNNLVMVYWLRVFNLNEFELHIFTFTYLEMYFIVSLGILLILINVRNLLIVQKPRSCNYILIDYKILNFWSHILYSLAKTFFFKVIKKIVIVPYFLVAELDLLIDISRRENQFSRSLLRRWTK